MIISRISRASRHFNTMSKIRMSVAEKYNIRAANRNRSRTLIRNEASLLFAGVDNQESLPSLIVNSQGYSYLFNCPEGFQRYCTSNKVKLINLEHIFVTNNMWKSIGGIYGLSLTLHEMGSPELTVHMTQGPDGLFDSVKSFIGFFSGMECEIDTDLTEYSVSNIKIRPIVLDQAITHDADLHVAKRSKSKAELIAYSCQFPDMIGPLDPEKCKQLKVPVGRQLSILKSGQDITLSDGSIVKSSDVCGPTSMGFNFIVIECPSLNNIVDVTKNTTLSQLREHRAAKGEREIGAVVHYGPQCVIQDPKYRQWMDGFSEDCKHLIVAHDNKTRLDTIHSYRLQYLLSKFDDKIFPELYMSDGARQEAAKETGKLFENQSMDDYIWQQKDDREPCFIENNKLNESDRFIEVNSMDKFFIRPKKRSGSTQDPPIDDMYQEAQLNPHFNEILSKLRVAQANLPEPKEYEPEVVFLGTGSAVPSKYRNTSCILVNFPHSKDSVILDCGEGSYGQLFRFYGPDKVCEILKQLKIVYVSHHHADHHIGLVQLILERRKYTDEPLLLLLPRGVDSVLRLHNDSFSDLSESYEIFSTELLHQAHPEFQHTHAAVIDRTHGLLDRIETIPVDHCPNSCATVMRFKIGKPGMDSFTLAYSGDAMPSCLFEIKGRGCDLLIHEATFEHRLQEDALSKKHSTSTQAIEVGRAMEAKFTILTHFSQRHPKIPYFTPEFDDKVGFAFDNMSLRCPSHFARLPILKPICSLVFRETLEICDMVYNRSKKRQNAVLRQSY